jgi:hypothetical protein
VANICKAPHCIVDMRRKAPGRYPKDPILNTLAHELADIKMEQADDLTSISQERFRDLAKGGEYPFRLVYTMPNFKTWAVRIYIGSETRLIGYTEDLTTACRFADMAQMRFWKYRIRGACEPVQANLNFTVEQAKSDCQREEGAIWLLDKIEKHFKDKRVIADPVAVEAERVTNRKNRDARRTVRNDYLLLHIEVMSALKVIGDKLTALCTRLNATDLNTPRVDKVVDITSNAGVEENNLTPIGVSRALHVEELFTQPN